MDGIHPEHLTAALAWRAHVNPAMNASRFLCFSEEAKCLFGIDAVYEGGSSQMWSACAATVLCMYMYEEVMLAK